MLCLLGSQVYKAKEKDSGDIVALKCIKMDNEREGVMHSLSFLRKCVCCDSMVARSFRSLRSAR